MRKPFKILGAFEDLVFIAYVVVTRYAFTLGYYCPFNSI